MLKEIVQKNEHFSSITFVRSYCVQRTLGFWIAVFASFFANKKNNDLRIIITAMH